MCLQRIAPLRLWLLVTLVFVPALAAAPAQAGWTVPRTLIRPGFNVVAAGNARGVEAFAWEASSESPRDDRSHVRVRLRLPDGRLSAPRTVSRTDRVVADATVGVDARGTATVVWTQAVRRHRFGPLSHSSVTVAVGGPSGRFGAPVRLGGTADFVDAEPRLAVAPNGDAVVLWSDRDGLRAVRRPPGRCATRRPRACFGPVQRLPIGADHTVIFGPRATAYAAWAGWSALARGQQPRIHLAVARRGRRFGSPRPISPRGVPASQPAIAVARDGSAVLAWRRSDPATPAEDLAGPIQAAVRDPQGRVSEPQTVSPAVAAQPNEPPRAAGQRPQLRLNRQGEAILVWQQFHFSPEHPDRQEIAAAVRPAGGTFGPAAAISPPAVEADYASLAVDRRGTAVVAWRGGTGVLASVRPPGGSFGEPAPPAAAGRPAGVPTTVAARDVVTAAWSNGPRTLFSDWTP